MQQKQDTWTLQLSPLPLPHVKKQIASWLGQLPFPSSIEIAASVEGLRVRLFTPRGKAQGAIKAWAALTQQQSRWKIENPGAVEVGAGARLYALHTPALLPSVDITEGDPFLTIGGQLLNWVSESGAGQRTGVSLLIWILGKETKLQERLRALAAYNYGTEAGVDDDTPNPWALRLGLWRGGMILGGFIAAICGGALASGWISPLVGVAAVITGSLLFLMAFLGTLHWMKWRSIPKDILEHSIEGPLLRVGFILCLPWDTHPIDSEQAIPANELREFEFLAGDAEWRSVEAEWPAVQSFAMPLPAADLAGLIAPPEMGEGSGLVERESRQDVPAPPPARPLTQAPFKIGVAVATGENIGIDPDGHGMAIGGSRTGKSSFVFRLLRQLIEQGDDAPGILLIDPHMSLADSFLYTIDQLPNELREKAIGRLRVITPDQPEVVPLNLLTIPEFSWAGNAIVQAGSRIWEDYWGPRMQAALLGLFRLAHIWNKKHPDRRMGLLHVVFAAFNTDWRHSAMAYLDPVDRIGILALDALLGQLSKESGGWSQKWATEVISPVLSKAMALELSPWLFAAMHQDRFVDLEKWVRQRCWIVLRLPSGLMGREGARLTAGIFYNVFDAAFRKATTTKPVPFYFVVDEAQEIAGGMQLEAMLSEGAKFGARMFILAQSLSMLRQVKGFEVVVQALLANTSTQAFFSPDPEDADLIRATLSADKRYGATTLDLPSLQAWLRARLDGRWQNPSLLAIEPLQPPDVARVQAIVREVIAAHPTSYAQADGWQEDVVRALEGIVPYSARGLLGKLLTPNPNIESRIEKDTEKSGGREDANSRRLGW
ncbi:MAG: type IV secretory system conjugative DNA transfer family protein [Anaerolineales bacterium]|jgi:hypothetical protein